MNEGSGSKKEVNIRKLFLPEEVSLLKNISEEKGREYIKAFREAFPVSTKNLFNPERVSPETLKDLVKDEKLRLKIVETADLVQEECTHYFPIIAAIIEDIYSKLPENVQKEGGYTLIVRELLLFVALYCVSMDMMRNEDVLFNPDRIKSINLDYADEIVNRMSDTRKRQLIAKVFIDMAFIQTICPLMVVLLNNTINERYVP